VPVWSELEQAFFDSAPPDEPPAPPAPESFDDLAPPPAPRSGWLEALRRRMAAAGATVFRRLAVRARP
jgi:hypothetical protein